MTRMTDVEQAFVLDPKNPRRASVQTNLHDFIANLPRDRAWRIEVGPQIKRRSEQQNRTLHMWINELAKQTGHSPAYMKEFVKAMFGPLMGEVVRGDQQVHLTKSTADYTVVEMMSLMTQIQAWAAEQEPPLTLTVPEGETW